MHLFSTSELDGAAYAHFSFGSYYLWFDVFENIYKFEN